MSYASSNEGEVSHLPRIEYLQGDDRYQSHGEIGVPVPSRVYLLSLHPLCGDPDAQRGEVHSTRNG